MMFTIFLLFLLEIFYY